MPGLYLPGAHWLPVVYRKAAGSFAPGMPIGYIPHVPVGNGSLFNYFNNLRSPNRKFATAWLAKDGRAEQYTELTGKPWAQVDGNTMYHAFEVEGYPNEPYTSAQLRVLAIWHNALGTVDRLAESPGQPGIGTHYMGGKAWGGHTCPDSRSGQGPRSHQRQDIINLAKSMRAASVPTPKYVPPVFPAALPPVVPALDPFLEDPMDRLILACYRNLCGRKVDPSNAEVDAWLVAVAKNGWTSTELTARFAGTAEAKAYAGKAK